MKFQHPERIHNHAKHRKRWSKLSLEPADFKFKLPTQIKGPLQKGKITFMRQLQKPINLPSFKRRNITRYEKFIATFYHMRNKYERFNDGEWLTDGLPGCEAIKNMPQNFETEVAREAIYNLNDETWLLPPDKNGKPQRVRLVDKDNKTLFLYMPSVLNQETCSEYWKLRWQEVQAAIELLFECHTPIQRGKDAKGYSTKYICHGMRGNAWLNVGPYVFKQNITREKQDLCNTKARRMLQFISQILTAGMTPTDLEAFRLAFATLELDTKLMQKNKQKSNCRPENIQSPKSQDCGKNKQQTAQDIFWAAIAASIGYISKLHRDNDMTLGAIGCVHLQSIFSEDIVTHFCFPDYKIAIPLRSGDLLLFNPSIRHCSLNPRTDHGVVFSLFNNEWTIPKAVSH